MNQVHLLTGDPRTGRLMSLWMTSSQVTKTFTSITLDRIELEPCARCRCICPAMMKLLISYMTCVGLKPELRPNFQINPSGPKCICPSCPVDTPLAKQSLYSLPAPAYSPFLERTGESQTVSCIIKSLLATD